MIFNYCYCLFLFKYLQCINYNFQIILPKPKIVKLQNYCKYTDCRNKSEVIVYRFVLLRAHNNN